MGRIDATNKLFSPNFYGPHFHILSLSKGLYLNVAPSRSPFSCSRTPPINYSRKTKRRQSRRPGGNSFVRRQVTKGRRSLYAKSILFKKLRPIYNEKSPLGGGSALGGGRRGVPRYAPTFRPYRNNALMRPAGGKRQTRSRRRAVRPGPWRLSGLGFPCQPLRSR